MEIKNIVYNKNLEQLEDSFKNIHELYGYHNIKPRFYDNLKRSKQWSMFF